MLATATPINATAHIGTIIQKAILSGRGMSSTTIFILGLSGTTTRFMLHPFGVGEVVAGRHFLAHFRQQFWFSA